MDSIADILNNVGIDINNKNSADAVKMVYISNEMYDVSVEDINLIDTKYEDDFEKYVSKQFSSEYKSISKYDGTFAEKFNSYLAFTNKKRAYEILERYMNENTYCTYSVYNRFLTDSMPTLTRAIGLNELSSNVENALKKYDLILS